MNNKGKLKIQGMLISLLFVALFVSFVSISVSMFGSFYDTSDVNQSDLNKYYNNSLSDTINNQAKEIDKTTVDKNLFDYLAGIFDTLLTPFKFIYRSYSIMQNLLTYAVSDLHIMNIVGEFLITMVVVLVIIGIVMIKFYMGREK